MKEEKVNFETVKLAKEKGFDINVNHFISQYNKDEGIVFSKSVESDNYNSNNWNTDTRVSLFSRPTQSLLQKWLREVHNIIVFVVPLIPDCKEFGVTIYSNKYTCEKDSAFYNQYEKALEIGLQEGLNLIPNKK